MITVNKAYEFKEATVFLEISNGLMTEEEAFKYCEYYLCENLLKLYLLRVYPSLGFIIKGKTAQSFFSIFS